MVLVLARYHLLWRHAGLTWGCWKHACFYLMPLHHLAAHLFPCGCLAWRVTPWCHSPWFDNGALGWGRWRWPMSHVARGRRLLRQHAVRCGAVSGSTDELGDALEPLLVEVVDGAVAKELPRHEQSSLHVHQAATRVGG